MDDEKGSYSSGSDDALYCICKKPDDHRLMLACEGGCEDWYHCSCMKIAEVDVDEDRNGLLDRFICPLCTVNDGPNSKVTTWKPMCRYHNVGGCRKAARVTDDPPSKYCSDEHKLKFWEYIRDKMARQDSAPSKGGRLNVNEIGSVIEHGKTYSGIQALGKKPRLPVPHDHDQCKFTCLSGIVKKLTETAVALGLQYLTDEERIIVESCRTKRASIEERITIYQRQKILAKLAQARLKAAIANSEFSGEYKDICGFDDRLSFNEAQFVRWAASPEGEDTMKAQSLGPRTAQTMSIDAEVPCPNEPSEDLPVTTTPDEVAGMCLVKKKKCLKHRDWFEIHHGDYWYQENLLRREARRLEIKEREIVEDAETREATRAYDGENTTEQLF